MTKKTAYNGSKNHFEKFDPRFINTGYQLQKHGLGFYFTSDPEVADKYRDIACYGENVDEAIIVTTDGDSEVITINDSRFKLAKLVAEHSYEVAYDISQDEDEDDYYEGMENDLIEFEDVELEVVEGAVHKVEIPDNSRLLNLDDYPSNVNFEKLAKKLLGKELYEKVENFIYQEMNYSLSSYEFDSFVVDIITKDIDSDMERIIEDNFENNLNTQKIYMMLGDKFIGLNETMTGHSLYSIISHMVGGDKNASELFNSIEISGSYTSNATSILSLPGGMKDKSEVSIIWDYDSIKLTDSLYRTSDIEIEKIDTVEFGDDSYDM